ncbi:MULTISPECIES: ATP-binding cassette domain-containing protein [unclassified Meiothermus]|uniref:branched-chain amino acid ABC transporter ATP-binding protein/permease n=1 Tax=unclassified Meiothermus TaxID=370471 RepID=UPI000D7CC902|nr:MULTISPECIES: ATP-binding cassette domain-containing protein [unclassified Meiothermus]PZA07692.1 ABC transporter [Meiothermus sp. Pnk-1]RYM34496.1 branched-chain amino acid ABC transporter ATP-binding protein/permease [Meiothermus sp. PNK-Is4]
MRRVSGLGWVGLLLLVALPGLISGYWLFLATGILIASLLTWSLGLLGGMAGLVSLCQLSLAGVGGWVVAYFNANELPVPFVLQVLIGSLTALGIGVLIGLPSLRVRGIHLAVVSLGFAAVADLFFTLLNFPGGVIGKPVVRPGWLTSDAAYYWFCLGVLLCCMGLGLWLYQSRWGSAWLAVKHSERAAAAMGINVSGAKLWAFALSAGMAGLAGGLLAGLLGLLSASNFAPTGSLVLFASAVMVGAQYPAGAFLAGGMSWLVPELLSRLGLSQNLGNLFFAFGVLMALKAGGGVFEVAVRNRGRRTEARPLPTPGSSLPPRPGPRPVLEVRGLSMSYGPVQALQRVSFALREGQVLGLIGPNGAGKSSLVDAVSGFVPYQGGVRFLGQALEGLSPSQRARAGLRRSFQQDRTIPELGVQAYLELAAGRRLTPAELAEAQAFAGLDDPKVPLYALDVGTRRRLEVAGILAARPRVVLLDEPAAGLSVHESRALAERIAQIPAVYGAAVLLIEHDMEVVRRACDEVVVLDFGVVIEAGPTAMVLSSPKVVAAYLGEEVAV